MNIEKEDVKEKIEKVSKSNFNEKDFENFESKVETVMNILKNMNSLNEDTQNLAIMQADNFIGENHHLDNINEDNFIVKVRENKTYINKSSKNDENKEQLDKFTFMQQMEEDANKRAKVRIERENIAQNFRKLGNEAFRKGEYEKAINMYTKAIDHVKDSPILYNNRALSYVKLKLYKRAVIDCDFVINKLDDKNLRSWLYRSAAYYGMKDDHNFNTSIKMAKKSNSKEIDYIDKFVENIKKLL